MWSSVKVECGGAGMQSNGAWVVEVLECVAWSVTWNEPLVDSGEISSVWYILGTQTKADWRTILSIWGAATKR